MFKAFPLLLLVVIVYNLVALGGQVIVGGESPPPAEDVSVQAEPPSPEAPQGEADPVAQTEPATAAATPDAAAASSAEAAPFSTYAFMETSVMEVPMPSGSTWTLNYGDIFLIFGMLLLFVELVRSTSTEGNVITNHALSLGVLVLCLIEFIIVPGFATSTFFFLMLMAAIDVVAGFIISIRGARRDLAMS